MSDKVIHVFVISDSLGETGELVVRAALSQFEGKDVRIRRFSYVEKIVELDTIIEEASVHGASIIFTLVVPELRDYLIRVAKNRGLPALDILGPLLHHFEGQLGALSGCRPGLLHRMDEQYFRKMEAVEFAVKYDDGRDAKGVLLADVVLIGVSRTSKTPLSMYLATRSFKVANVPLVPEIQPMRELFATDAKKMIGLRIEPQILLRIREARLKTLGLDGQATYASLDRIRYELDYADQVMTRIGCRTLDVSNKAVEETAARLMKFISS